MKKGQTKQKPGRKPAVKIAPVKKITEVKPENITPTTVEDVDKMNEPAPDIKAIEPQFQRLMHTKGFIGAFWEMMSYYNTHESAYEAVEKQYEAVFGKRKYASFESFRICRDKYLSKVK